MRQLRCAGSSHLRRVSTCLSRLSTVVGTWILQRQWQSFGVSQRFQWATPPVSRSVSGFSSVCEGGWFLTAEEAAVVWSCVFRDPRIREGAHSRQSCAHRYCLCILMSRQAVLRGESWLAPTEGTVWCCSRARALARCIRSRLD